MIVNPRIVKDVSMWVELDINAQHTRWKFNALFAMEMEIGSLHVTSRYAKSVSINRAKISASLDHI